MRKRRNNGQGMETVGKEASQSTPTASFGPSVYSASSWALAGGALLRDVTG